MGETAEDTVFDNYFEHYISNSIEFTAVQWYSSSRTPRFHLFVIAAEVSS
jgi:hypothetical protein